MHQGILEAHYVYGIREAFSLFWKNLKGGAFIFFIGDVGGEIVYERGLNCVLKGVGRG